MFTKTKNLVDSVTSIFGLISSLITEMNKQWSLVICFFLLFLFSLFSLVCQRRNWRILFLFKWQCCSSAHLTFWVLTFCIILSFTIYWGVIPPQFIKSWNKPYMFQQYFAKMPRIKSVSLSEKCLVVIVKNVDKFCINSAKKQLGEVDVNVKRCRTLR
jgi:hypothetical protein